MNIQDRAREEQLVVFELAHEFYGVDISRVQEINRMQPITAVPKAPSFVRGIIDLRSNVVPVVDLRARLGMPRVEETPLTRIVVLKTSEGWVGVIVDAVSEVLRLSADTIEPPSSMITSGDATFLRGIAKLKERLIILLDLDKVLDKASQIVAANNT